jgi:hypothetical protein
LLSKSVKIKIYRTIILLGVLYGCETWSLTLKEEGRLRVFENRVLKRIFGPRRDKVTGEWRRLHNQELYALYSSPNIIWVIKSRRLRQTGHVAHTGERWGNLREGDHLEDPGVDRRIIFLNIVHTIIRCPLLTKCQFHETHANVIALMSIRKVWSCLCQFSPS